mmetsp:Transcript_35381/g.46710  ORF Transcript_35381/g.46710 Transcript_35381/m.46710 type:complete len:120 (-) Transcript_35381:409-768(-)
MRSLKIISVILFLVYFFLFVAAMAAQGDEAFLASMFDDDNESGDSQQQGDEAFLDAIFEENYLSKNEENIDDTKVSTCCVDHHAMPPPSVNDTKAPTPPLFSKSTISLPSNPSPALPKR